MILIGGVGTEGGTGLEVLLLILLSFSFIQTSFFNNDWWPINI
ncbi:hypothetical protein L289_1368 [Acinetobacter gerneri DSM 14967 = CIP 107464 = MTCC 9824]|nr:hypothetical protein L289_1368 [Acinetobacter gerneri DSM 14967 = CIP 107464 = MTCC 9824]